MLPTLSALAVGAPARSISGAMIDESRRDLSIATCGHM
jgi:hypothetical protein